MRRIRPIYVFKSIAHFIIFQMSVVLSDIVWPSGEDAGLDAAEQLKEMAGNMISPSSYISPFILPFLYVATIEWYVLWRRRQADKYSFILDVAFGLYYGVLFRHNLNGFLHSRFDQALGINPIPPVSAMFPLFLAFVPPLIVIVVLRPLFARANALSSGSDAVSSL